MDEHERMFLPPGKSIRGEVVHQIANDTDTGL
jgi:hypothetical protein